MFPANKALGHRDFMVDSITPKRVVKEDWEKIKKSAKHSGEWKVQKAELDADIISLEKIILPEFAKIKFPKDAITDNDALKKFVNIYVPGFPRRCKAITTRRARK